MPPSFDHDGNSSPSGTSPPRKSTQKGNIGGGSAQTRNGKKNGQAKDVSGGGVLAAVTKNASKNSSKNAKVFTTPPATESPELAPVISPPVGPPSPPAESLSPPSGNHVTSPLLDALSSAAIARSSTHNTNEWAKNVPAYSSSPSNLINLGESPPTLPSSYDERLAGFGWTTREQRGTPPTGRIPSASPPSRTRPLSYHMDGNYPQLSDDNRAQMSAYAARRSSMYAQHPRFPHPQHPPLPHQAQAHFYGAPDPNILLSPPGPGLTPGESGYYCGFDSVSSSPDPSKPADKVILTGYDGGINIHTVTKRGIGKLSTLDNLRGGVYGAKIIPSNVLDGVSNNFPLIVLVIHGPVLNSGSSIDGDDDGDAVSVAQNESVRGSPNMHSRPILENEPLEYYQTTVEVYSLVTKQNVATLLSLPQTPLPVPSKSSLFKPPPPVGALTIRGDAANVVIASGNTGETWIFRLQPIANSKATEFKCIGKVWTAVQHGISVESNGLNGLADGDWYSTDTVERKQYKASILSLNGRWLAFCPSAPSSQVSLRAVVPGIPPHTKVPGLLSQAPPQLPSVNCTVETPGGESMVKQIMQAGTQALIEGTSYIGKHIGKQGANVWNSYWNRTPTNQPTNGGIPYQTQPNTAFPPTHGAPTQAPPVAKDPGLVSILDLESLAHHSSFSASPHPLATFKIPHGCSFLSFAPSGLALFTASSKGDIQNVWDLMRIQYSKSSFLKGTYQGSDVRGPHVRQIAQFSRMTIARIVDVVWASPHGERAVMVTEPGTVHILDLPASAFTWPPPRRRMAPPKSEGETASTGFTASGVATNAVNSLWTAARPLVSRPRRSSASMSAKTVTAHAGHGTQALAAGISRSVGAATGRMNEMRKAGSTKLHLPRSTTIPTRCCVILLNRKQNDSVIVVAGGIVRLYTIKNRRADRPADKQKASRGAKYVEFRLPSVPFPDYSRGPEALRDLNQASDLELTEGDAVERQWKSKKVVSESYRGTESSIPQAEIESNAPYQPFHTDRRVAMFIYSDIDASGFTPSVSALLPSDAEPKQTAKPQAPWAFGRPINTMKLDVGPAQVMDDDLDSIVEDLRALPTSAIERILRVKDSNEDIEQIVVTTRRRKGAARTGNNDLADADEEGFFEDDCEVLDFATQRV
ncbi:hypothetical protein HYFRA_00005731 [Hymenoscyphus fraxineus]|uniref:WD40 repeat-like protein n=1 Tax=Hymenoscyphus fraxineus TaxID=746836 RepID=A0A9N9KR47_9HELO|nr:hypothetical protein HYFRA_00005731 [Hymenoscyphus fraxineus]